jgi:hypothetical protein
VDAEPPGDGPADDHDRCRASRRRGHGAGVERGLQTVKCLWTMLDDIPSTSREEDNCACSSIGYRGPIMEKRLLAIQEAQDRLAARD